MHGKLNRRPLVLLSLIIIAAIGLIIKINTTSQTTDSTKASSLSDRKSRTILKNSKQEEEATIKKVVGKVERMRGNEAWSSVYAGDRLKPQDSLRTGASGKANLEVGHSAQLMVSEQTQVKVEKLNPNFHEFSLQHGHVIANYSSRGRRMVRIGGDQQNAVVEANAGRFHVLKTQNTYGVAAEKGTVRLRSARSAIKVNSGEWSVVVNGKSPSPPAKIPAKLLLKVAAATRDTSNPCAVLEGVASPGAEVTIGSQVIGAGLDGRFHWENPSSVDSPKGHIRVLARHLTGEIHTKKVLCATANDRGRRQTTFPDHKDVHSKIHIESIKFRWQGEK